MIRVLALYHNGHSTLKFNLLRVFLIFILGKKLAIVLKSLLVLEAIVKVVIIVKSTLIQRGTPLLPRTPIYRHVNHYLQLFLVVSPQTTPHAGTTLLLLPSSTSLIGMTLGDYS